MKGEGGVSYPTREGPVRTITGKDVKVYFNSKARALHVGAFAVSRQTWSIHGVILTGTGTDHPCRSSVRKGCAAASQLRAVGMALLSCAPETTLKLFVSDKEVVDLLEQWRAGDTRMPIWYGGKPDGALVDLAQLVASQAKMFTVERSPMHGSPNAGVARLMASSYYAAMLLKTEAEREKALDESLRQLLARLPNK